MKKVVLIAPANDYTRDEWAPLIAPPLGILALGSYLAAHDVPVELIDVQTDFGFGLAKAAEHVVLQQVVRHLANQANTIAWIGISQLFNADSGVTLAQEIRNTLPDIPIIFGGYFPSNNYRRLLEEYRFITAVVKGDGEATALEISRRIAQGQSFLSDEVLNLAWMDEGQVRTASVRPMPVDNLPILDFKLLANPDRYQIIALMTSRGCPFKCTYCFENSMRPYTAFSSEWVARQLAHLETVVPNDCIFIYDPVFGIGEKRTSEICRIMHESRFTYGVESRVDVLKPQIIPTLKEANVEVIFLGMESASPGTLVRMNKVHSIAMANRYTEKAMNLLKACFEVGIATAVSFMIPFPGDVEEDWKTSLAFTRQASQFYETITAQTGIEPGFLPYAWPTRVYDDTPLAEQVERDFPETVLQSALFFGERTVLSSSPKLAPDILSRYRDEIEQYWTYTPEVVKCVKRYIGFAMKELEHFLETNPELISNDVVRLGKRSRDFL